MALPEMIKNLLENGVHFGHLSKHWNPKMKPFIFGKKKKIYIIDLQKTAVQLEEAKTFVRDMVKNDAKMLFVGTKRHIRDVMRELAESCEMPYVVERWVGGLLTNFVTIEARVRKYNDLRQKKESGELDKLPSKERAKTNKDLDRMAKIYSGVAEMDALPQCIFVIDPKREHACVHEANILDIPIVALVDTDADPDQVDYPVPGNDDAIKSVRMITAQLVEAIKAGKEDAEAARAKAQAEAESQAKAEETGSVQAEPKTEAAAPEEKTTDSSEAQSTPEDENSAPAEKSASEEADKEEK